MQDMRTTITGIAGGAVTLLAAAWQSHGTLTVKDLIEAFIFGILGYLAKDADLKGPSK